MTFIRDPVIINDEEPNTVSKSASKIKEKVSNVSDIKDFKDKKTQTTKPKAKKQSKSTTLYITSS